MKFKVAGWKETTVQVHSCKFCYIFKNNYVVVHVRTVPSDILGYPSVGISSARSTLKKCTVFFSNLLLVHFKLILGSYTTSGVYLEQYQTSMMKFLAVVFSQKRSIIDICQGSKHVSAASFFNIFHFLCLAIWMNIWTFCFSSESVQLLCFAHVT